MWPRGWPHSRAPKVLIGLLCFTLLLMFGDQRHSANMEAIRRQAVPDAVFHDNMPAPQSADEPSPPPALQRVALLPSQPRIALRSPSSSPPSQHHPAPRGFRRKSPGLPAADRQSLAKHTTDVGRSPSSLATADGSPSLAKHTPDVGRSLASLVSASSLRLTFPTPPSSCGRSGACRIRVVDGSLYRSEACNPRRYGT